MEFHPRRAWGLAGFGQSLEEQKLEMGPAYVVAIFVVADAGIHNNPSPLRFYDERLDA